jgi:hypothetical protein
MSKRRKIVTAILGAWQLFLAISSFIITKSEWWFWCALCFIIAVIIAVFGNYGDEEQMFRK